MVQRDFLEVLIRRFVVVVKESCFWFRELLMVQTDSVEENTLLQSAVDGKEHCRWYGTLSMVWNIVGGTEYCRWYSTLCMMVQNTVSGTEYCRWYRTLSMSEVAGHLMNNRAVNSTFDTCHA